MGKIKKIYGNELTFYKTTIKNVWNSCLLVSCMMNLQMIKQRIIQIILNGYIARSVNTSSHLHSMSVNRDLKL